MILDPVQVTPAPIAVKTVDQLHILVGQFEVENAYVFLQSGLAHRLGDDDKAALCLNKSGKY